MSNIKEFRPSSFSDVIDNCQGVVVETRESIIEEVTEHFKEFIDAFIEYYSDDIDEGDDYSYLIGELLSMDETHQLLRRFPHMQLVGGGAMNLVVRSLKYPDVVLRWYHTEASTLEIKEEYGFEHDQVSYSYANFKGATLSDKSKSMLVDIINIDSKNQFILSDYIPSLTELSTIMRDGDLTKANEFILAYCNEYKSLVKEGFFITDLSTFNMTINNDTSMPIIVDLDCLVYCEDIVGLTTDHPRFDDLFKISHIFSGFKGFENTVKEIKELYKS